MEGKPSLIEGTAKQSQKLTPEHAAEHAHRQEESGPAGDPARAIESQPASRHDAMHMRMVLEVLAPGVEDRQDSDLGPEMLGIGGDLLQRFGGGSEQKAVDLPLILKRDRTKRRGKRKNHMKVLDGQELGFPCLHPLRRGGGLALGTVAVAARVVGDPLMPALIAGLGVTSQRRGSADGDILQDAALLGREYVAVPFEESIAVLSEDVGHFELRPSHGFGRPSVRDPSRSSGLCVASRDPAETWV